MSTVVRTPYCYPMVLNLSCDGLVFDAREADHERCPGGHAIKGVMGGWICPCPCHRPELQHLVEAAQNDGQREGE